MNSITIINGKAVGKYEKIRVGGHFSKVTRKGFLFFFSFIFKTNIYVQVTFLKGSNRSLVNDRHRLSISTYF